MEQKKELISCKKCGQPFFKVSGFKGGIITVKCHKCQWVNVIENKLTVVDIQKQESYN